MTRLLVPYPNYAVSAWSMSNAQLWLVRQAAMETLHRTVVWGGGSHLPDEESWNGHGMSLALYCSVLSREMMSRHQDIDRFEVLVWEGWPNRAWHSASRLQGSIVHPGWIGDVNVHEMHRQLLRELDHDATDLHPVARARDAEGTDVGTAGRPAGGAPADDPLRRAEVGQLSLF